MELHCSYLLHTFYGSSDLLMKDALRMLKKRHRKLYPEGVQRAEWNTGKPVTY